MDKASFTVFSFAIFSAVAVIMSLFLGFVWRNSLFIIVLSVGITFFLMKNLKLDTKIPLSVSFLAILVFFMLVYPLLFVHPFFSSSADPAPTIASLVIGDKIPETYAPYSDLAYTYQPGFPLISKVFIDIIPLQPHIVTWFLAALSGSIQVIFIYLTAFFLTHSRKAGIGSAFLFTGTKVVFQNMYFGEYTWMLATVFFLGTFVLFTKRSRLAYILFPAIFITHPGVGFNSLVFFITYAVFFRKITQVTKLLFSLLLAIPVFVIAYLPLGQNLLSGATASTTGSVLTPLTALPLWVGIVPSFFVVVVLGTNIRKKRFPRTDTFLFVLLATGLTLFFFFLGPGPVMSAKIVELITIAAVLLGGSWVRTVRKSRLPLVCGMILVVSLILFTASGFLEKGRIGSKITQDEASFSLLFKAFDADLKKVFIFSPGGAKIAEFANKIPYNIRDNHFISSFGHGVIRNAAWDTILRKDHVWNDIISRGCVNCALGLDVNYVVVNNQSYTLPEMQPVVVYKNFFVYSVKE